jgi:DNA helicase II / ATP-dependent DNA helicase PcrA
MTLADDLNPEQKDAVETVEGPLLVLAGAGSGKTRVVTFRIVRLLEKGVPAHKILGLTFTNKAANEMKERVRRLTHSDVLISTFHSLGARVLRESIHLLGYHRSFTIYDEDDVDRLLKTCLDILPEPPPKVDLKVIREAISSAKNNLLPPDSSNLKHLIDKAGEVFPLIYAAYQAKLLECNAVDYDDLLYLTVRLLREHPHTLQHYQERWHFLLIDEYQDTNVLQYTMISLLADKYRNICVVGDPDQSIYSWRGANIQNILNFENDYSGAKVIQLNQNYRSRSNILNAANALIKYNRDRYEKKLWSDLGPGEKIKLRTCDDEKAEARYVADCIVEHYRKDIPLNQMVVFYRTNAQSRVFEDHFLQRHIPYVIVGSVSFYQRREIKDILAWLRMVQTGTDLVSFERTINLPKRGFGDTTLEKMRMGASQENRSIMAYCEMVGDNQSLKTPLKLSSRQKEGLQEYIRAVRELRQISQVKPLSQLVTSAITISRYKEYLAEDPETQKDRMENLNALIAKASDWDTNATAEGALPTFLEELSLKSSLDEADASKAHVSLMTIHNGKGLEFTVTFLAGLEELLFPHANSYDNPEAMEEERRLCYVGVTRAKEYLYLTNATMRFMWGVKRIQKPSRFLREIPREYLEESSPARGYPKPFSSQRKAAAEDDFIDDIDQTQPERPVKQYAKPARQPVPSEPAAFDIGDAVYHKEFGIGHILDKHESTAGLTYKVLFTKGQLEKSLVAKYAQLTRL